MENTSRKNFIASLVGASIATPILASSDTSLASSDASQSENNEFPKKKSFNDVKEVVKLQIKGYLENIFYFEFTDELSNKIVSDISNFFEPFVRLDMLHSYKVNPPTINEHGRIWMHIEFQNDEDPKSKREISILVWNSSGDWDDIN